MSQRGFTLIELMITVGVGAILSTTFFTIMYWQNMQYYEQLDNIDAHQNARAALNIMKRYVRASRFGFMTVSTNTGGVVGLGRCYNTSNTAQSQGNCHNVDPNNNDRMRVIFINNDQYFVSNPNYSIAGGCNGTTNVTNATALYTMQNANGVIPATVNINGQSNVPNVAAVGGICANGNYQNDLVTIAGDSGSALGCSHHYAFSMVDNTTGDTAVCAYSAATGGSSSGWSFGTATVADFFVANDPNSGTSALWVRTNPNMPLSAAYIAAFDIQNLQVNYGIDTTTPPDRLVDQWCPSPGDGTCTLTDSQGSVLTTTQLYNRVMAVQLTVQVRTDELRKGLAGSTDGFRYWTYTETVSLRNNGLYQ